MTNTLCPRCKRPISAGTARTMTPGSVALHRPCSDAASDEAWRRLEEMARRPKGPTYRVVGVRKDGRREVLRAGLGETQAAWERNDNSQGWKRRGFRRFVIEPE